MTDTWGERRGYFGARALGIATDFRFKHPQNKDTKIRTKLEKRTQRTKDASIASLSLFITEEERKKHTGDHNNPKYDKKKQKSEIFWDDDKTTSDDNNKSQDLEGEVKWTEEERKNDKVGQKKKQNNEKKEGVKATKTRKSAERNDCSEDIEADMVDQSKAKKVKYIAWFHVTIATFTPQIKY